MTCIVSAVGRGFLRPEGIGKRAWREGVLVTPYPNTSYLAATYTPLRPYFGHPYNTPDYPGRVAQVESWLTTGRPELALSFPAARSDRDISRLAQEVFALPGRIADNRGRKLAIALDEFQAIGAFNGSTAAGIT